MNTLKALATSILAVALLFILAGCDDFLGDNNDPNTLSSEEVRPEALLPPTLVQSSKATFNVGFTFTQYAQHISFEASTDEQETTRLNSAWTNIYLRALTNAEELAETAREQESPHYLGIGKVIQAYNLGLATTSWEDVPWSEAIAGQDNFNPAYDSQEEVYTAIDTLLDGAVRELEKPPSELNSPGSDDIIYGGDADQWIRLAYGLKARYALHRINRGTQGFASDAVDAAANAQDSNEDDFQLAYNGEENLNPWHTDAVLSAQTGNPFPIQSDQFIDLMNGETYPEEDPRLPIIADKGDSDDFFGSVNGNYGNNPEGPDNQSTVNFTGDTFHSQDDAPVLMMTYAELKFIEAEAQFLVDNGGSESATGASQAAYDAYKEGIRANMDKLGVNPTDRDDYLTAPTVDVGATNLTMELIMKEKYKALFLNPEVFVDLRRYDFDSSIFKDLELPVNHNPRLNGQWIKRALYPDTELSRNANQVPSVEPETSMWFMTAN